MEVAGVAPEPKFHAYDKAPTLKSVKVTIPGGKQTGASLVKLAVGALVIMMVAVSLAVHAVVVTVKMTVFVPPVAYTIPDGFSKVEVAGVASPPKSQK